MKTGNVTGNVYKRSVHRKIETNGIGVKGAEYGEGCAFLTSENVDKAPEKAKPLWITAQSLSVWSGAEDCQEQELQKMTVAAQEAAQKLQVTLADVKVHVSGAVIAPVATAEALAEVWTAPAGAALSARAGQQIVMTKWAGLAGTVRLEKTYREALLKRYPAQLLDDVAQLEQHFSILPEAAVAGKSGVGLACAVSEGGVFHALWTLAEQAGTGLEVSLKKLPIRQETVEICNELDVNPYELSGNGSLLFVTDQGEMLAEQLQQQKIPAAVIGFLSADNDRVIVNGEERRFLEPANTDAIYRME